MKMALSTFLCFAIHADGDEPATLVSSALQHYRDALDGIEPPLAIPSFLEMPAQAIEVDVAVDPALEKVLRTAAARQGVEVKRLLGHVVLLYLADRDRAAEAPDQR
jgi:hypothetical protein